MASGQGSVGSAWGALPPPVVVPVGAPVVEPEPEPGWSCAACTFVNPVVNLGHGTTWQSGAEAEPEHCVVCNTPRAQAAAPQRKPEGEPASAASTPPAAAAAAAADEAGGGAECSICLGELVCADVATAECGHRFCTDCILQWLDVGHGHCPMCKAGITHLSVRRQLDGTRVAEPISEPVILLLRARWRERPAVLPHKPLPSDQQPPQQLQHSSSGWADDDYGYDEDELMLRGRASSRVSAEHRGLNRGGGASAGGRVARKKPPAAGPDAAAPGVGTRPAARRTVAEAAAATPFAGMVGCRYRCVAQQAYATEEISPKPGPGLEVTVINGETVITCLEARMAGGAAGQSLRLRCNVGWVSYVAKNGTQLFELDRPVGTGSAKSNGGGGAASRGLNQSKGDARKAKKERREEKAAAKAARRAAARREDKVVEAAVGSGAGAAGGGDGGGPGGGGGERDGFAAWRAAQAAAGPDAAKESHASEPAWLAAKAAAESDAEPALREESAPEPAPGGGLSRYEIRTQMFY